MARFALEELDEYSPFSGNQNPSKGLSPHDLSLKRAEVDILYADYNIRNNERNMTSTVTEMFSEKGILFCGAKPLVVGALVRVYVKLPQYWMRKSRHVDYRHTDAPDSFQILCRVLGNEELFASAGFRILCENLNMDASDEAVLSEYLKSF